MWRIYLFICLYSFNPLDPLGASYIIFVYEGVTDSRFRAFTQNKELKALARKVQMRLHLMSLFSHTLAAEIGSIFLLRDEHFYSLLKPKLVPCFQLLQHNFLHLAIALCFVVYEVLIPVGCRWQRRGGNLPRYSHSQFWISMYDIVFHINVLSVPVILSLWLVQRKATFICSI
jgi:hypothetical protein